MTVRDNCICRGACVPECPVDAIFLDEEAPEASREWIALNRAMAVVRPPITARKPPLADSPANT